MPTENVKVPKKERIVPLCAYCGLNPGTTRDHVIPRSLFAGTVPTDVVTVPACRFCNEKKSQDDDYLRDILIFDNDSGQHSEARTLFHGKATRSMQRNRSQVARLAVMQGFPSPRYSRNGLYLGNYLQVPLDEERLNRIFGTIIRGLYYRILKQRILDSYVTTISRIDPLHIADAVTDFRAYNANGPYRIGNVFGCFFLYGSEDANVTAWLLWFYDGLVFMVSTEGPIAVNSSSTPIINNAEV